MKAAPSEPATPPPPAPGDEANHPGGRPTLYKPEYAEQVRRLCAALGATDEEVGLFLGVTTVTLWRWKHEHPEFCNAMRRGKRVSNRRAEDRLYSRAMGYSHEETDIKVIEGKIVQTPIVRHYPPSEAALRLWLTNRDPRRWRNLISTTVETPPGKPLEHQHTYGSHEVLEDYYARQRTAEAASAAVTAGAVGSRVVPESAVPEGGADLGTGDEGGEEP